MSRGLKIVWMIFIVGVCQGQVIQIDSVQKKLCVSQGLNYIQYYDKEVWKSFFNKWSGDERITITLFGDSHVQPDIYPGEMRRKMQAVRGDGGFGMAFPYSAAKTYSAIDYFSSHTGNWLFAKSLEFKPKLPLGVSGVTIRTNEGDASLRLKFKKPLPPDYRRLKVYSRQDKRSFDFTLLAGGQEIFIDVDSVGQKPIEVILEKVDSSIEIQLKKQWSYQNEFEFYGVSIESVTPGGVLLHSLGIGGSRYGSLLEEKFLEEQLPTLQPDLVILDFGTNDFLYDNQIPVYLEDQIIRVIQKVRKTCPGTTILLTTVQDMNRKGMNVTSSGFFSDLIRKVAKSQSCAFYDWYWISGGPEKMTTWMENGLAQQDMIHLTMKGYTLKGQMMAEALMKTMKSLENQNVQDSMLYNLDSLKRSRLGALDSLSKDSVKTSIPAHINFVRHKIVKGETLKSIAKLYHVRVGDLKRTNGLQNSVIIEGNYLNIEVREAEVKNPSAKRIKAKTKNPGKDKYLKHKVKEGDTLSELALKYKVGVIQIQKLNGLKSSRIRTGQNLKIKPLAVPVRGR